MKSAHFLSSDLSTSQDLASGALDYTFDFTRKRKVEMVIFHFSQAVSENIKITLDSAIGSNYDGLLQDIVLVAEQDYIFRPQGELNLQSGDKLRVQCTNANLTGVCYVSAKTSEM